jgi:hypothetical protein
MTDYYQKFLYACRNDQIEEAKRLVQDRQVDIHANREELFRFTCWYGKIELAKWLVLEHQVDVHALNNIALDWACGNNKIEIVKWLVKDHQVDVRANSETALKWLYRPKHNQTINWIVKKYRYSESPYYYHEKTVYILNHEPLDGWHSCTILDYPIIYCGKLDEPAVIAYMATLKRPKSARS